MNIPKHIYFLTNNYLKSKGSQQYGVQITGLSKTALKNGIDF